jgi:hypothetical protein
MVMGFLKVRGLLIKLLKIPGVKAFYAYFIAD